MTNQMQTQNNQVQQNKKQNSMVTQVAERITEMRQQGQINLPENYSAVNALQAAYFKLTEVDFANKTPLIEKVTPDSVAFALQDMAIQGLSVAKKQGYFINYNGKLQFQRSYHGTQAVLRRLTNVKDMWANVIWKGEEFEVEYNERGQLAFKGHKADWQAATGKKEDIIGAYCIIERTDGTQYLTVMTMAEIQTAWSTSKNQSVQNKYPQEMAKRTVINRASKTFLNTSDDSDVLVDTINRTTENEYDNERDYVADAAAVQEEINENANKGDVIGFDEQPKQPQSQQPIDVQHEEIPEGQQGLFDAPTTSNEDDPF